MIDLDVLRVKAFSVANGGQSSKMRNIGEAGILTFHYSTNFGGVLQSYALYKFLEHLGISVELIDYIPSTYHGQKVYRNIGFKSDFNVKRLLQRMRVKHKFCHTSMHKFEHFRRSSMRLSSGVDESTLRVSLGDYDTVVVGSDQIWGLGQRGKPEYFLGFDEFKGNKVSYAADSTIAEVSEEHIDKLRRELGDFDRISVRNKHSQKFVETVIGEKPPIVADPTLLWDFNELGRGFMGDSDPYILVYVLGKDINGSNRKAIEEIKRIYGNLKVYAIVIPTMKFNICDYADKVFYDLGPEEWLDMIRNATFVYTDSFHGTLFSLKFHKPFLAYYAEAMRATRFIDLAERYQIGRYIVSSVDEIEAKGSLLETPDFATIDQLIEEHRAFSIRFLEEALGIVS